MKPKDDYMHGECPDCGTTISDEAEFGESCPGLSCGHVYTYTRLVENDPPNGNCLKGLACPKCKSKGPFMIATTCWAQVHDDGIEDTSEHEWDENSACLCKACTFASKVGSFEAVLTEIEKVKAEMLHDLEYDHPSWGRCDWRKEVVEENTQLGYFDWVIHSLESHADDAEK
jgi:hypothetical protein